MCNDSRIKSTRWQTNDLILYLRLCVNEWLKSTGSVKILKMLNDLILYLRLCVNEWLKSTGSVKILKMLF